MRDDEKHFICYRQGWSMKIVPRNAAGWRAFGLWMAGFGLMLAAFLASLAAMREESALIAATVGFVALTLIWTVAMLRWMMARSEVVDLKELLEIKRERDKGRRR